MDMTTRKKLLFATAEGIGNVIQTIPVIRTLNERLDFEIDLWLAFGSFPIPNILYVDKWIVGGQIRQINLSQYEGVVSTYWTREHIRILPLKLLNKPTKLSMTRSEVDCYMDIARDLGAKEKDLIWHGKCLYNQTKESFDVVVHNGYNPHGSANWKIKSYPHYAKVVEMLTKKGLKICSVGAGHEYINGTINRTGFPLLVTLGIINNCKVFLGNDSGLYHCANALSRPNVVIFTATSIEKNFDERFHKYTTIIGRDDLECRPCQAGRRWNKDCKTWDCQQVDPEVIYKAVMEKI